MGKADGSSATHASNPLVRGNPLVRECAYIASSDHKPTLHFAGEWDSNPLFHEKVCCHMVIRLIHVDAKSGMFVVRVKCHWAFRTHNTQDNSELLMRGVPGIRIPALITTVEESRVWKDAPAATPDKGTTNHNTVYWKGTSTFILEGFKIFHMDNFPFDRHVINLENIDFVWRPEKESADYYKSMKVVILTTHFVTVLTEWNTCGAYVLPVRPVDTREYGQTFNWQLRIERQDWFYIRQVFWLSYLMTTISITPLAIPNGAEKLAERLSVYGSGMLTLVTFKYSVAAHLPTVPYGTFADDYLSLQILTIALCGIEALLVFFFNSPGQWDIGQPDHWDIHENWAFGLIFLFWTCYLLFVIVIKRRWKHEWEHVFSKDNLEGYFEMNDPFNYFELTVAEDRLKLAKGQREGDHWFHGFLLHMLGGYRRHPKDVELEVAKTEAQLRDLNCLRERLDTKQKATAGYV